MRKIRISIEYGAGPVWIYNENGVIINVGLPTI